MSSYLLKITLRDTPNLIWRRFVVPSFTTLDRLHEILQTVMGWQREHSHVFHFRKQAYSPAEKQSGIPEELISLDDLVDKKGAKFQYVYDPGTGNWVHDLLAESTRFVNPDWPYAVYCLEGVRACPPDSCADVREFCDLLKKWGDPKHPEYESLRRRFASFDDFDLEKVNKTFKVSGPARQNAVSAKEPGISKPDPLLRLGRFLRRKTAL